MNTTIGQALADQTELLETIRAARRSFTIQGIKSGYVFLMKADHEYLWTYQARTVPVDACCEIPIDQQGRVLEFDCLSDAIDHYNGEFQQ